MTTWREDYNGPSLRDECERLLKLLEANKFIVRASGSARKTLQILRDGVIRGYRNADVMKEDCCVGYSFLGEENRAKNAMPLEMKETLAKMLARDHGCDPGEFRVRPGGGSNSKYVFLYICKPEIAAKVLCAAIGVIPDNEQEGDPSSHLLRENGEYREGRIVSLVMTRVERSWKARNDCLTRHGFRCVACKCLLRNRYFTTKPQLARALENTASIPRWT